jgi:hypothetical protein
MGRRSKEAIYIRKPKKIWVFAGVARANKGIINTSC